jgi:hypothetical protein
MQQVSQLMDPHSRLPSVQPVQAVHRVRILEAMADLQLFQVAELHPAQLSAAVGEALVLSKAQLADQAAVAALRVQQGQELRAKVTMEVLALQVGQQTEIIG